MFHGQTLDTEFAIENVRISFVRPQHGGFTTANVGIDL